MKIQNIKSKNILYYAVMTESYEIFFLAVVVEYLSKYLKNAE